MVLVFWGGFVSFVDFCFDLELVCFYVLGLYFGCEGVE